jgi:hypothetical protein
MLAVLALASAVLALWSRPALAATAPLCDERGATVLAPPPAPPSTDEAISRGRSPCRSGATAIPGTLFAAPTPGHAVPDSLLQPADAAVTALAIRLPPLACSTVFNAARADAPSPGVCFRVERPPRA